MRMQKNKTIMSAAKKKLTKIKAELQAELPTCRDGDVPAILRLLESLTDKICREIERIKIGKILWGTVLEVNPAELRVPSSRHGRVPSSSTERQGID